MGNGRLVDAALNRHAGIRSILIAANPKAGGFRPALIASVAAELERRNIRASVYLTKQRGDITRLAQDPGLDVDAIAVHGGDGTIGEAVAGLHGRQGRRPVLIVIPGGTASVLACELELPSTSSEIVQRIIRGKTAPLYYGLANGRPFFLMVSAGVDAEVVHGVSPMLKRLVGKLAYVASALAAVRRRATPDIRVETSMGALRCRLAVVTNSACYGGAFVLSPDSSVCRPGLRLVVLPKDDFVSLLRVGWRMLRRGGVPAPFLGESEAVKVRLTSEGPAPVQIDGDAFGTTPVEIEPVERPLRIIV